MLLQSLMLLNQFRKLKNSKKGEIELDQLGKLIIGIILFIILIYIVTVLIGGEFGAQKEEVTDIFSNLEK